MIESCKIIIYSNILKLFGLLVCILALCIIPAMASDDKHVGDGYTSIFNGKDLTGWHLLDVPETSNYHTVKGNFFVKDNAIHCTQMESRNGALLISDKKYNDFELVLEIKSDWGCDSGVFLRTNEKGKGIQILNDYLKHGSIGFPYQRDSEISVHFITPDESAAIEGVSQDVAGNSLVYAIDAAGWNKAWKTNDWNQLKIRMVSGKPTITTWLNGTKVMEYRGRKSKKAEGTPGHIALQVHPGNRWKGGYARYRNIAIKELTN